MGAVFYHIFLLAYSVGAKITSYFNPKAKKWIDGRKNWHRKISDWRSAQPKDAKTVWLHCASLGEFEQGRPVLEAIKEQFPEYKIVLTFFSPSGYEEKKTYTKADYICYLPLDNVITASKFVETVKPSIVVWVKYDYWYYYLSSLKQANIPVVLISAIFRPSQPFFKWYGKFWIKILQNFTHIFVQTKQSAELLKGIGIIHNVSVAGDTRFDRVMQIAANNEPLPTSITDFCGSSKVIVAGSTWEDDEAILKHYAALHREIKFIIAPHEVDTTSIAEVQGRLPNSCLYSAIENINPENNVLIIDNIGMLSRLYKLATITYVGGGFNDSGIHNTLEAAVHEKPVVFGPVYEKFAEAVDLVSTGAASSIASAIELEQTFDALLQNPERLKKAGKEARNYVLKNCGATKEILDYLCENRLLIK